MKYVLFRPWSKQYVGRGHSFTSWVTDAMTFDSQEAAEKEIQNMGWHNSTSDEDKANLYVEVYHVPSGHVVRPIGFL